MKIYYNTIYTYCIYSHRWIHWRIDATRKLKMWDISSHFQDPQHHLVWELGHHRAVPVLVALQLPAAGAASAPRHLGLPDSTYSPQGYAAWQGEPRPSAQRLQTTTSGTRRWLGWLEGRNVANRQLKPSRYLQFIFYLVCRVQNKISV